MRKAGSRQRSTRQADELAKLAALPDSEIDTREAPEQVDGTGAKRGVFYRHTKRQLTLRLDVDVVEWFKRHEPAGKGYQTSINSALREYVSQRERR